jgi:hypothetical protein
MPTEQRTPTARDGFEMWYGGDTEALTREGYDHIGASSAIDDLLPKLTAAPADAGWRQRDVRWSR